MSKFLAVAIGLALAVTVAACSGAPEPTGQGSKAGTESITGSGGKKLQEAKKAPTAEKGVVPDVLGVTQADGETVIKEAGFKSDVQAASAFGDKAAPETILICEQDPKGGDKPSAGTTVELTVENSCG